MAVDSAAKVLITGAGPVGLTLAGDLARRSVGVRIVDREPRPSVHSKALAIFPRTLEELAMLGVVDRFLEEGVRVTQLVAHADGRELMRVPLEELPSRYPFVLVLSQSRTETLLEEFLARHGVHVEREVELTGVTLDPETVHARLQHADGRDEQTTTPFLAACDGAHSTVRHALGLPFTGERNDDVFVLADVHLAGDFDPHTFQVHFARGGPLALIPLGGGQVRVVAAIPPDESDDDDEPTLDEIRELVRARASDRFRLDRPQWISRFRISRRLVPTMRLGRVFFCGDAAHIHSPVGGQGMNTGMQDAFNLGWKLDCVVRGRAPGSLLDSFDAERRPVAESVLAMTHRLTTTATLEGRLGQSLRNGLLHVLGGFRSLTERAAEGLAELRVDYRASPIVAHHGDAAARVKAGDRAPDGELQSYDGTERRRLHDWLKEGRHVLFAFAGSDEADRTHLNDVRQRLRLAGGPEVAWLPVGMDETVEDMADAWHDVNGRVHATYGAEDGAVILVRPDGYVGYRGSGLESVAFLEYWSRHYAPAAEVGSSSSG